MMTVPYNIPPHTGCKNCGACCGPFQIFRDEEQRIRKYIEAHPEVREVINQPRGPLCCVFRDEINKRCAIYPARPLVCRLYGVFADPFLQCPHGNSAQMTGIKPDFSRPIAGIQNNIEW